MFQRTRIKSLIVVILVFLGVPVLLYLAVNHANAPKQTPHTTTLSVTSNSAFFQVKASHVSGDGTIDDTNRIRRIVQEAAAVGGTVFFESGTYRISAPVSIPAGVSILGSGSGQTVFKATEQNSDHLFTLGGNQTVENVGFVSQIGVQPAGDGIIINNCRFQNSVQGIQNSVTVRDLTVINCLFERSGYGILSNQQPSYNVRIIHCQFVNNFGDAIEVNAPSEDWVIENCTFRGITSTTKNAGFGVGAALSAQKIVIKGCTFEQINGQGIHVEDHAQVAVVNSSFRNNGAKDYPGSPEADIAVLSRATIMIDHSIFLASDPNFSHLAIYNTDLPVGGTVTVRSSKFYKKDMGAPITSERNSFFK